MAALFNLCAALRFYPLPLEGGGPEGRGLATATASAAPRTVILSATEGLIHHQRYCIARSRYRQSRPDYRLLTTDYKTNSPHFLPFLFLL